MRTLPANRFTILLSALIAFILVVPPVVEYTSSTAIVPWALSVIVVAIVLATRGAGRSRIRHPVMLGVALASLAAMWSCNCFVECAHVGES